MRAATLSDHNSLMDIANLRTFVAVAESRSFSLAAERLHLTQPAVSKRIQALEANLDTRLLDRIGRQIVLTEAGRELLPRARHILLELKDSRRAIANLAGHVTGVLRIGTSHHIGLHHLPPVLRSFVTRYPDVDLDLQFMDSEAACQAVAKGELELGIVTLPPEPPGNLILTSTWPDPLLVMAAGNHPLGRRQQIHVADLSQYPAIMPAAWTYTRQIVEQALRPFGVELKIGLSTNYLETIKMLVSVGLGWSILPRTLLDKQVRALPIPALKLQRTLGFVQHQDRTLSNAAKALIALLETQ